MLADRSSGSIWAFVGRAILPAAGFQPALGPTTEVLRKVGAKR